MVVCAPFNYGPPRWNEERQGGPGRSGGDRTEKKRLDLRQLEVFKPLVLPPFSSRFSYHYFNLVGKTSKEPPNLNFSSAGFPRSAFIYVLFSRWMEGTLHAFHLECFRSAVIRFMAWIDSNVFFFFQAIEMNSLNADQNFISRNPECWQFMTENMLIGWIMFFQVLNGR